ncbi:CYTH domain-containing protein [Candidatus Nomurabacteria bacterium]|nr:CYTH domain-containing protein [Candidatus Saccharibacteria bacterium]MCA9313309.1 CYTH domain-containing protein [Candidatus Saccharibacteria bacterium]MCB9821795.1 CYTH domain-containing protein [Candidatus Nomurabacteria bacterium]
MLQTEFEAKFLNINIDEVRVKLKGIGAELKTPMRMMKRVTIDNGLMKSKNAFLRVRDEGDKVTLTYKQFDELSVEGAKEIELAVGDFDKMIALLKVVGLPHRSFQESKRETWQFEDVEIMIDEWPWLPPYIEIESDSEDKIKDFSSLIGLDWNHAVFGDVMTAYKISYPHLGDGDTIGNLPEVRFDDPLPEMLMNNRE